MRVLITGSAGFVGIHVVSYVLNKTNWEIVCLDSLKHMGDSQRISSDPRVTHFTHDLNAPISEVLKNKIGKIDYVINLASDSAVGRSIETPRDCWNNNTQLIINILEYVREVKPDKFIHISTDEIYGECYGEPHKEWSMFNPTNPYSASKLAQEALCISYYRTFRIPLQIINCQNMFGEYQNPEKMIPKTISNLINNRVIPIYSRNGKIGSRKYTDSLNLADGILYILNNLDPHIFTASEDLELPDRYHVAGGDTIDNLELVKEISKILGVENARINIVDSETIRPGYDKTYALDDNKIRSLGWVPPFSFKESLLRTINWFKNNQEWL
jgi:dTDP-glucose 4,6-dehydratase